MSTGHSPKGFVTQAMSTQNVEGIYTEWLTISTTICGIIRRLRLFDPFLVSYRIRLAMKTTAPRTAPHLTYIQGIGIPNKASFEILAMNTGLN